MGQEWFDDDNENTPANIFETLSGERKSLGFNQAIFLTAASNINYFLSNCSAALETFIFWDIKFRFINRTPDNTRYT